MKIARAALEAVHAHAAEGYPYEICGMLTAAKGSRQVTGVKRATNAIQDRPHDTYQIAPQEHLRIENECDAEGLDIVGYYHSHPDHASYASVRDTEQAWPDYYYLIVSCMKGEVRESKVFRKRSWNSKRMLEESLQVVSR